MLGQYENIPYSFTYHTYGFSGVRGARSLVSCIMFQRSLFVLLEFGQDKKMLIAKYTEYLRSISLDLCICSALSRDTYITLMTQCVDRSAYIHY